MPAYARCQIVEPAAVGIYHCINRCVRRAFLCGQDPLTGRSFEHRRTWIRQRLETLAGLFAVDVLGFTVMANHLHLVLRIRPDLADRWDDETIARRWWQLFPQCRDEDGDPATPEPHELRALRADPMLLAERRGRLASLSWFMRCLSEPIARRANREDGCTGRFWEGRFKCQALLDEAAVLACSIYVDLNPIRAGIAATPEVSEFTGAFERIAARQAERTARVEPCVPPSRTDLPRRPLTSPRDGWLSPIPLAAPGTARAQQRCRLLRIAATRIGSGLSAVVVGRLLAVARLDRPATAARQGGRHSRSLGSDSGAAARERQRIGPKRWPSSAAGFTGRWGARRA